MTEFNVTLKCVDKFWYDEFVKGKLILSDVDGTVTTPNNEQSDFTELVRETLMEVYYEMVNSHFYPSDFEIYWLKSKELGNNYVGLCVHGNLDAVLKVELPVTPSTLKKLLKQF